MSSPSFLRCDSAARSSGVGCRSKLTPSVEATGGGSPGRRGLDELEELDVVVDDLERIGVLL
jgi:hypothetical protein